MKSPPVIHWFRQDLRLHDNPALSAAIATGQPVIPLFVLDVETPGRWAPGGASRWWLHHSLAALGASLGRLGAPLILRRGRAAEVLPAFAGQTGSSALFWTRCYERHAAKLDDEVRKALTGAAECRRFGGNLLYEPEAISHANEPYKVFTPFWKACLRQPEPKPPASAPSKITPAADLPESEPLDDWRLLPKAPDWAGGLRDTWTPGEAGARQRLETFVDQSMAGYKERRNRPDLGATSMLSPHLHHGEISPRQCWHAVKAAEQTRRGSGADAFLRELIWRDFCHHQLHHWPSLPERPLKPEFDELAWRDDKDGLRRWQEGRTGYPMVDAGMRELWHTGWMHNRVRMIVASFLTKDLLLPWQDGEAWFWDTLVDADLANNAANWQWVAGCGADAAPYFRIFNPILQSRRFDPDGAYLRRWLPELAKLPSADLHAPWELAEGVLNDASIRLGKTYPRPMIEHGDARRRALGAYDALR